MVTVRGKAEVARFIAHLPAELESKVLRGAAKAAAKVIATEAKELSESPRVASDIVIRSSARDGLIVVKVTVKRGWSYSVGVWLEWGTDPHLIRVDESQRQGMTIGKINRLAKEPGSSHSLVIGGNFVGASVMHPGARPHPFLRPALDIKGGAAIAAAQTYINARVKRSGIVGTAEPGDDE